MANNIRHQAQNITMIKIKNASIELDQEGFNNLPPKERIDELLIHYLGQNGISKYKVVDADMNYWKNENDTLVIEIDPEETWRFGAENVMRFALNLANFVREIQCDEFHEQKNGRKTLLRFWWD